MISGVRDEAAEGLERAASEVAAFPVSRQAATRLLAALDAGDRPEEIAVATESSVSLTLAVLRTANGRRAHRGTITDVPSATEVLDTGTLRAAVETLPTYEVLEGSERWDMFPEQVRVHATAVRSVAERVASATGRPPSGALRAGALLHDIGKAMLVLVHGDTAAAIYSEHAAPEEEVQREAAAMGIDHAAAGEWLLRYWDFPDELATTVGEHHRSDADGDSGIVRVADMLVHYSQGHTVDLDDLTEAAADLGLHPSRLSELMYELPDGYAAAPRTPNGCPLSERELDVLRLLAEGKVYKQIAQDLHLSTSTVRSHLHRAYKRMGVADRTQAVLVAREQGWL